MIYDICNIGIEIYLAMADDKAWIIYYATFNYNFTTGYLT